MQIAEKFITMLRCPLSGTPLQQGDHGLASRDGSLLYVANRGSNYVQGKPKGQGSVSVIDFASGKVLGQ